MAGGAPIGNTNATKAREVENMLRRLCVQEDYVRLRRALSRQLDIAADGNLESTKFLVEKLDGKSKERVELSGADGGPIVTADARSLLDGSVDALIARMRSSENFDKDLGGG